MRVTGLRTWSLQGECQAGPWSKWAVTPSTVGSIRVWSCCFAEDGAGRVSGTQGHESVVALAMLGNRRTPDLSGSFPA